MISHKKAALFAVALAFAGSAQAYTCQGRVTGVTLSPSGQLTAAEIAGLQWPYLCELNGSSESNATTQTCKAIYALLLTAQASGKHVQLWFNDSGDCTTHTAWQPLTGWYWGPMLVD
ncbi:hypothetical protein GCM10011487_54770 [Steroidobacter agaridevorans]|uniref:Uncharacterized protein n=1 Tax=Steroidobacter agaridevorans TaxID=2695856 RepID=A0A829YJG2_9GAMM|nr:hypothetical protein [Steroidobacter agaridevorans]GFE83477.1 hypothetical protein GCM10011487_54770 [Steroidobacter agaridevorans]GFE86641.1 hypothetical protein GCM10011488_15950 [Steroidobacter agaridevorans]